MIDIASFTRLCADRQTYHSARRELKASLTRATAEQVPVRVWSCCTFVVPNRQRLLSYMGQRCEKWLSVGDRTRNLSLRLLVPPVKRRKGPLPFKHSSCQTKTRQEVECLAPGSLSRCGFFFSNSNLNFAERLCTKTTQMGKSLCLIREPDTPK